MKKPNTTTAKNARPQPQETPATAESAATATAVASEGSPPLGTDTAAKPEVVIVEPAKGTGALEPEPRKAKGAKEGVAQIVTRFPPSSPRGSTTTPTDSATAPPSGSA